MTAPMPPGFYTDPNGQRRWWDETGWGALESELPGASEFGAESTVAAWVPRKRTPALIWVAASVAAVAVAIVGVLLVATFGVERWEKVVTPEQPETFSTVEVPSGVYAVTEVDGSPCWVGQDWNDCINLRIDQWNFACAERYLTESSMVLCDAYDDSIYEMQSQNLGWGSTVSSLGGWGKLEISEQMTRKRVSNNDYVPAQTRQATCLLGVFIECRWHDSESAPGDTRPPTVGKALPRDGGSRDFA